MASEQRRLPRRAAGFVGALAIAALLFAAPASALMDWPDLMRRPMPEPNRHIALGGDPLQSADLWLPAGPGPYPLVILIHGGCWRSHVAKASIMNWIADDLRRGGAAVWNIEYRGIDWPGGGYPGTFEDVAGAADAVRAQASVYRLRLDRVVVVGHSAGGHLALWLAARAQIKPGDPLYRARPLPIHEAVSLGGLPDLEAASTPPGDTCDASSVRGLVGASTAERPDVYADTSPARLPSPSARVVLVNATEDPIAPPEFAQAYAKRMARKGPEPERRVVSGEGHVELISPGSRAWALERELILNAAR